MIYHRFSNYLGFYGYTHEKCLQIFYMNYETPYTVVICILSCLLHFSDYKLFYFKYNAPHTGLYQIVQSVFVR